MEPAGFVRPATQISDQMIAKNRHYDPASRGRLELGGAPAAHGSTGATIPLAKEVEDAR